MDDIQIVDARIEELSGASAQCPCGDDSDVGCGDDCTCGSDS